MLSLIVLAYSSSDSNISSKDFFEREHIKRKKHNECDKIFLDAKPILSVKNLHKGEIYTLFDEIYTTSLEYPCNYDPKDCKYSDVDFLMSFIERLDENIIDERGMLWLFKRYYSYLKEKCDSHKCVKDLFEISKKLQDTMIRKGDINKVWHDCILNKPLVRNDFYEFLTKMENELEKRRDKKHKYEKSCKGMCEVLQLYIKAIKKMINNLKKCIDSIKNEENIENKKLNHKKLVYIRLSINNEEKDYYIDPSEACDADEIVDLSKSSEDEDDDDEEHCDCGKDEKIENEELLAEYERLQADYEKLQAENEKLKAENEKSQH